MMGIVRALWWIIGSRLKSRERLEAENLALRQQLNVVCRSARQRPRLRGSDRLLFVWLYRLWPCVLDSIVIVQPETVLRWHRGGFKAFWRRKSQGAPGRPRIPKEIRHLIREVSLANPLSLPNIRSGSNSGADRRGEGWIGSGHLVRLLEGVERLYQGTSACACCCSSLHSHEARDADALRRK